MLHNVSIVFLVNAKKRLDFLLQIVQIISVVSSLFRYPLTRQGEKMHMIVKDIPGSTIPETVTPLTREQVRSMLADEAFGVVDAPSGLFQVRYAQTDGSIIDSPVYYSFKLIEFAGQERIEFIGPFFHTVKVFPDGATFAVRP